MANNFTNNIVSTYNVNFNTERVPVREIQRFVDLMRSSTLRDLDNSVSELNDVNFNTERVPVRENHRELHAGWSIDEYAFFSENDDNVNHMAELIREQIDSDILNDVFRSTSSNISFWPYAMTQEKKRLNLKLNDDLFKME